MTATVVIPAASHGQVEVQQIDLGLLNPSWMNPRKTIDAAFLSQLADSIVQIGVQVPLVVRPAETPGQYEIIAGHRRYFAARMIKLETLPCIVREMSDDEARELMLVENLQREDLPPLEEADAYFGLMQTLGNAEKVAARVGKPIEYVTRRLKLLTLIPFSREALSGKLLTLDHALLLCKLAPAEQETALRFTLYKHNTRKDKTEGLLKDALKEFAKGREDRWGGYWQPEGVLDLKRFIEDEIKLELKRAPWDLADANLLPAAGACTACPKNTASNTALFGDLAVKEASCTDSECFAAKRAAFVQVQLDAVKAAGRDAVRVSWKATSSKPRALDDQNKYLGQVFKYGQWIDAKKGACEFVRAGVTVDFDEQKWGDPDAKKKPGMQVSVCVEPDCKVHKKAWKHQAGSGSSGQGGGYDAKAEEEKRKKQEEAVALENQLRMGNASAALDRVKKPSELVLRKCLLLLLDRLNYDVRNAEVEKHIFPKLQEAVASAPANSVRFAQALAILSFVESMHVESFEVPESGRKEFLLALKVLGYDASAAWKPKDSPASPRKTPAKKTTKSQPSSSPARKGTKKKAVRK